MLGGIQNYVLGLQAFALIALMRQPELLKTLELSTEGLKSGEIWRLLTWYFVPPVLEVSPLWALFYFLVFFSFAGAVEQRLGARDNTAFYLLCWLLPTLSCALFGAPVPVNLYLSLFVFLVYCGLYHEQVILMMFILPVPIRILGPLSWILFFLGLGSRMEWLCGVSFLGVYMLMFGLPFQPIRDVAVPLSGGKKKEKNLALHTCAECGATEITHPDLDFRVTPEGREYCVEHLGAVKRAEE